MNKIKKRESTWTKKKGVTLVRQMTRTPRVIASCLHPLVLTSFSNHYLSPLPLRLITNNSNGTTFLLHCSAMIVSANRSTVAIPKLFQIKHVPIKFGKKSKSTSALCRSKAHPPCSNRCNPFWLQHANSFPSCSQPMAILYAALVSSLIKLIVYGLVIFGTQKKNCIIPFKNLIFFVNNAINKIFWKHL